MTANERIALCIGCEQRVCYVGEHPAGACPTCGLPGRIVIGRPETLALLDLDVRDEFSQVDD